MPQEQQELTDNIDIIIQSFNWIDEEAQRQIITAQKLIEKESARTDLEILKGVLGVAISGGVAGASLFLASKLVHAEKEGTKEFIKNMFEDGLKEGLHMGAESLGSGPDVAVTKFIDSQSRACEVTYMESQKKFTRETRHTIDLETSRRVAQTCAEDNMKRAGELQRQHTIDAWSVYLARSTFGELLNREPSGEESSRTYLANDDRRNKVNDGLNEPYVPTEGPTWKRARSGDAPGVLSVRATLPDIQNGTLEGVPKVKLALLNGVNDEVRETYKGQRLSFANVPRQVTADVEGSMPNFVATYDEKAETYLPEHGEAYEWLKRRGELEPSDKSKNPVERGAKLLLDDLQLDAVEDYIPSGMR